MEYEKKFGRNWYLGMELTFRSDLADWFRFGMYTYYHIWKFRVLFIKLLVYSNFEIQLFLQIVIKNNGSHQSKLRWNQKY